MDTSKLLVYYSSDATADVIKSNRKMLRYNLLVFLLFAFTITVSGQSTLGALFSSGDFQETIDEADKILKTDSKDPAANFFKGASLVRLKEYEEAGIYLTTAIDYQYQPAIAARINLLRMNAGLMRTDIVLDSLSVLADNGFAFTGVLAGQEFSYLSDNTKFASLIEQVNANRYPCRHQDQYKKLDFWIGEWNVMTNGSLSATSTISESAGGCTIHEDYQTTGGFYGSSLTYFDPVVEAVVQVWVDNTGSVTRFVEVDADENMFQMQVEAPTGLTRMTYIYDPIEDAVTQTMEGSTDGGATWTANFVGEYVRRNE